MFSEDEPFFADLALKDLLPDDQESFYTYEGSLTTPSCSETVTWIVMKCPITVSVNVIILQFINLHITLFSFI